MCLAVPGKVLSVTEGDPLLRTGRVEFGGVVKEVSLACVPDAMPGQYVLVHVGMAISTIDETEAHKVFEFLAHMGDLEGLESDGP